VNEVARKRSNSFSVFDGGSIAAPDCCLAVRVEDETLGRARKSTHTWLIGIVVPIVATVGAIRLAKPTSVWARKRYKEKKLNRSHRRFDVDYQRRRDRIPGLAWRGAGARRNPRPSYSQPGRSDRLW
jgi:hypothetical protein